MQQLVANVKNYPRRRLVLIVAVIVLGLWGFFSGVRQIGTGQVGVVTRYGQVTGRELHEGLHVVLPFGVEQVAVYDVKVLRSTDQVNAASKDLQDVSSTLAVNYRVDATRVKEVHQKIGVNYVEKVLDPATQEVFKATSAKFSAQELITNRAEVKAEAFKEIRDRLEKYGIVVDDLSIVDFKFSDSFTKAIEDKQVAQQNAERAKFNLEAARVDAEAQSAQAATLSPLYLQKQAIDKWDGKMPTYMGDGTVFNIPLR